MARLRDFAIVVVVFSLVTASFVMLIGGIENAYGDTINENLAWKNDSFNATFNKMDAMYNETGRMANKTQEEGLEGVGIAETLAGGTWDVIVMVWKSFGYVGTFVTDASEVLGLPPWFVTGVIAIITITMVFTIISLFTRRDA